MKKCRHGWLGLEILSSFMKVRVTGKRILFFQVKKRKGWAIPEFTMQ
jgi:hypothetical protein